MLKSFLTKYGEIIRYLIIGIMTTVVSLVTYYILVFTILNPENAFELQAANIISWIISVTFAYFTNRTFVFRVKDQHLIRELIKFFLSRILTLLIDMGIMFIFVTLLHLDDKIVKLIAQIVVIILNYILSKFLVFTKKDPTESPTN